MRAKILTGLAFAVLASTASAETLTIYSGRGEALIGPLVEQFKADTGIEAEVRYGSTSEMATLVLEEGENSPADLFWAQDAGALGALSAVFTELPAEVNASVLEAFRNDGNKWVATSGRTRVLAHSTERVAEGDMPVSIKDLTDEKYRGRVSWAPTNGSFQAFITAFRLAEGDDTVREWLEAMKANDTQIYRNNGTQLEGIANGEVDFSLNNNYYLGRYIAKDPEFPVTLASFAEGDIGNLALVAGTGILQSSDNKEDAQKFIDYLLSPAAQQYITLQGNEYPVRVGIIPQATLVPLASVEKLSPKVDLNQIGDLEGTLTMLREVGLL